MGRIVVTEFVSLDGVMEDPGGAEGFKYGGWTFEINRGEDGDKFKLDETLAADALLLGRVTYEGFADAWPQREGEFADKFNEMPKYVVSKTLTEPEWSNSTVLDGDLAKAVEDIRGSHDGDIVVRQRAARAVAARARPRRRAAPDGLPGRTRERQAPFRRDERQEAAAADRFEDGRRRRGDPHLRACARLADAVTRRASRCAPYACSARLSSPPRALA